MNKVTTILVSVFLSIGLLYALNPWSKNTINSKQPSALETILERGVLKCGYASFDPMIIIDPNTKQISGMAYEIMEEVGKKLGVKIEWSEESGWAEYVTSLNNKRFDLFCAGNWPNSKRARLIAFTSPFAFSLVDTFVRADDTRFDKDQSLLHKVETKMAVVEGSTIFLIAEESFPELTLVTIPELSPIGNLFLELLSKKADIVMVDRGTAYNYMKHNPNTIKRLEMPSIRVLPNIFSLDQGEPELQQALNEVLRELQDAGVTERIIKKYEPIDGAYFRVAKPYQQAN